MASRCINALNELDAISDKIFYKYSKNRLKKEIASKVRDSKSRAEGNVSCTASRLEKCTSRKSNQSNISSNSSTATTKNLSAKAARAKSTSDIKTPKYHQDQRKSKSSYQKKPNHTTSVNTTEETVDNAPEVRSSSIFGKYTPGAPKQKTGKWFNLQDGVNQGVIDSFACDKLKEKALCYKVDAKESKAVPKLLRHRLEVRIGQNGEVRNEDGRMKHDNRSSVDTPSKSVRTAPLSWEEQLNWENTCVITPRTPQPPKSADEGLNETHPVIFHPNVNYRTLSQTTTISNEATVSYRLYMDKKLVSDRRNLTCGRKCVTSVEIEEALVDVRKVIQDPLSRSKSHDSDLMDMSNTIKNIEKIYRTASQESARKVPLENAVVEENLGSIALVENPADPQDKSQDSENMETQDIEKAKINKKVSFKDEIEATNALDRNTTPKENLEGSDTTRNTTKRTNKRPSSSRARFHSIEIQELKVDKPRRPYTAPHCSPRMPIIDENNVDKTAHMKELLPIWVPTSNEILSENENEKGSREDKIIPSGVNEETHDTTNIHVTFACKSAPTIRTTHQEDLPIARSQSTICTRVKSEKYKPIRPNVVLDNSEPLELPSNVPPGQALIELRKKIRENLAKETADLQLDIQQLYLKHHSYNN